MSTWWIKVLRRCRPCAKPPVRALPALRPADGDRLPACGWFESSWELEHGLAVTEVSALEAAVWQLVGGEPAARLGSEGRPAPAYFSGPV